MQQIKNTEFSGERPLFASHDLYLENVTIHAGESALKECSNRRCSCRIVVLPRIGNVRHIGRSAQNVPGNGRNIADQRTNS